MWIPLCLTELLCCAGQPLTAVIRQAWHQQSGGCPLTLVTLRVHVQVQRLIAVITKSQELQPQEVDKANLRRATHTLAELSKSGELGLWAALCSISIQSRKACLDPKMPCTSRIERTAHALNNLEPQTSSCPWFTLLQGLPSLVSGERMYCALRSHYIGPQAGDRFVLGALYLWEPLCVRRRS